MRLRAGAYSAEKLRAALEKAEGRFTRRPDGADPIIKLHPSEIKIRPELFQPREFSFGLKDTDTDHVKKLARAINIKGELDPVLVVKLGKNFVCVDGHHRLEAYKAEKWAEAIRCEWFGGTLREAVDESMARNGKDRLNVPQADRLEQAWRRVLLQWGSKRQIVELCGVGDGTVAHMRRVKERGLEKSKRGDEFRRRLGGFNVFETSWAKARLAYLGEEPEEADNEVLAERLAMRLRERLTDLLSRNPNVTARALELYDPKLPKGVAEAWGLPEGFQAKGIEPDEVEANAATVHVFTDRHLEQKLRTYREGVIAIEAELARRANGGTPSDHTWAEWVSGEPPMQ